MSVTLQKDIQQNDKDAFNTWFDERLEMKLTEREESKIVACPMTMDLFGWKQEDMIPEISDWLGAGAVLPMAQKSDVTLFV